MSRVFDIKKVKWTEEENGVRYCVFRASKQATVQYYEIPAGKKTEEICSTSEILTLCEHGICDYIIDDKGYTVKDGVWCWIPPNSKFSVRNHEGTTAVNVRYYLPEWEKLSESPEDID